MAFSQKSNSRHKKIPQASKLVYALIFIRAGAMEKFQKNFLEKISQCRNFSRSAENSQFRILIHCQTISYPYTLSKTLSQYIAETIPYLNTLIPYPFNLNNVFAQI